MQAGRRSRKRTNIAAVVAASLLVLAVYVGIVAALPRDVFWHPDEGAKFIVMETVRWSGRADYSLPYAGREMDPEYRYYPARDTIYPAPRDDGSIEFRWPIFFPLLSRLGAQALGAGGIYAVPVLAGWLVATLAGIWTYLFRPRLAPLAILLAGLATPLVFYSVSFFEHTLTTLLAALALTVLMVWPGRIATLLAMSPLLAAAVALRAEMVAFVAAMLLAWAITAIARRRWEPRALLRARRSTWILAIAAIAVLVVLAFVLDDIVPARHLRVLADLPHYLNRMWFKSSFFFDSVVRVFLGEPGLTNYRLLQIWQIAALMALGGLIAAPFADTRQIEMALVLPSLFVLLQTSLLTALFTLPFLQRQGVLAVAPFIGISVYGLPEAWRRRDLRLLALSSAGVLYALLGFSAIYMTRVAEHDGGSLLGLDGAVRYILTLYPIGVALSVVALAGVRDSDATPFARACFSAMVVALMIVSVYYQALGVMEIGRKREVLVQWRDAMRGEEPVVTDLWWLPAVLAPYWVEHPLFVVPRHSSAETLAAIGDWAKVAGEHGVRAFSYATTSPVSMALEAPPPPFHVAGSTSVLDLNLARFQMVEPSP